MTYEGLPEQEPQIYEDPFLKDGNPEAGKAYDEALNEGYSQVIELISSIPHPKIRNFLTASLIAISLNFMPGDSLSSSGDNDIYASNPLVSYKSPPLPSSDPMLHPDFAFNTPSVIEEVPDSNEVDTVEYLDLGTEETYFVVPTEDENNTKGYDLIESSEMVELSEADKMIVESSPNVLPILMPGNTRTGDRFGSMNLTGRFVKMGPSIYLNEGLLTSHTFQDVYKIHGEDTIEPDAIKFAIRDEQETKFFPYAAEFASNYTEEGLDSDTVDSSKMFFLSETPINFVETRTEIHTRGEISKEASELEDQDVWVTGYPGNVAGGKLTRTILKGKISGFGRLTDGSVANIRITFPEVLDKLILGSFGISGGKVSVVREVDGELVEIIIGTYRGHVAEEVDGVLTDDIIYAMAIPFEEEYTSTGLKNAALPDFGVQDELPEGSEPMDVLRAALFNEVVDKYTFDKAIDILNDVSKLKSFSIHIVDGVINLEYEYEGRIKTIEFNPKLALEMPSVG